MSATMLRKAAGQMRFEWPEPNFTGSTAQMFRAVAEWLDYCATYRDGVDPGSYASAIAVARAYLGES